MPRELVVAGRERVELRSYEEPPLGAGELRIHSDFCSNKHGTLFRKYRGDPNEWHTAFERHHRISHPEPSYPNYPLHVGNMAVGTVTEVGADVSAFSVGDRVFGHLPVRETHTVAPEAVSPAPAGMAPEAIVYQNPAGVGVHLVRDGGVALGDCVAVFGAGAIGQMAAQLARVAGARTVVVSDPVDSRRAAAESHGADLVVDPTSTDAAVAIKEAVTAGTEPGVDVALETSAAYAALDDAVRAVAYGGTVASCAYYEGDAAQLALAAEFHRNDVSITSIQPGSSDVMDFHPRWAYRHLHEEAFRHLVSGAISVDGLIGPVVALEEAPAMIERLVEDPSLGVKMAVRFD